MKLGEIKQEKKNNSEKELGGGKKAGRYRGGAARRGSSPARAPRGGVCEQSRGSGHGSARLGSARLGEGQGAPCRV